MSGTIQKIVDHKKPGIGKPYHLEMVRPEISFDAEFSLPPGFFDRDFLEKYEACEPPEKEKCNSIVSIAQADRVA